MCVARATKRRRSQPTRHPAPTHQRPREGCNPHASREMPPQLHASVADAAESSSSLQAQLHPSSQRRCRRPPSQLQQLRPSRRCRHLRLWPSSATAHSPDRASMSQLRTRSDASRSQQPHGATSPVGPSQTHLSYANALSKRPVHSQSLRSFEAEQARPTPRSRGAPGTIWPNLK